MERLTQQKKRGLNNRQLVFWGLLFLLAGMFGQGILQNRVLQLGNLTDQQLLEVMSSSGAAMAAATAALVMKALETFAIPIFAFLLVAGFEKTQSRKKMFLTLLLTAAVSEIPYNLIMGGKLLDLTSRNPALAMVIGMLVLYFFRRYEEKSMQNTLLKTIVCIAAVLWCVMLNVEHGVILLVVTMVMWTFRNKGQFSVLFGAVVLTAFSVVSVFYIISAMGILPVYFYREEDEEKDDRMILYLAYPVLLLTVGLLSYFI